MLLLNLKIDKEVKMKQNNKYNKPLNPAGGYINWNYYKNIFK